MLLSRFAAPSGLQANLGELRLAELLRTPQSCSPF
jgi:hypothetical protein